MPRILLLLGLAAATAQQDRFCLGGVSATHGPYRICCPAACGACVEDDKCRARPPGGLVCCPVSGVLASRRRCSRRKDAACYARDDDPEFFPWLAVDAVQRTQQPPSSVDGAYPWVADTPPRQKRSCWAFAAARPSSSIIRGILSYFIISVHSCDRGDGVGQRCVPLGHLFCPCRAVILW